MIHIYVEYMSKLAHNSDANNHFQEASTTQTTQQVEEEGDNTTTGCNMEKLTGLPTSSETSENCSFLGLIGETDRFSSLVSQNAELFVTIVSTPLNLWVSRVSKLA